MSDEIERAYAAYDADPRVHGPDDFEAFSDALKGVGMLTVTHSKDWSEYRENLEKDRPPLYIRTLNERLGSEVDDNGGTWVIKDTRNDSLCALAGDRYTAQHILWRKAKDNGLPLDTYDLEVWSVMQSPEDYDAE